MVYLTEQNELLSDVLHSALDVRNNSSISLGELMNRIAERGYGLLFVILALPTLFPLLPPGSAATIGFVYILIGGQMLFGRKTPWLPQRVRKYRLSEQTANKLRERSVGFFKTLERFSSPRWLFMEKLLVLRLVALTVVFLGFILLTPLPFMNTLPAFAVLLLGTGLLNRDGVFLLLGLLMSFGLFSFIYFGLSAIFTTRSFLRTTSELFCYAGYISF
ncbi:MAG: exopolysaccharide biosynthesis protein [Dethiobacter sp.]|nr:exopolysaccharide biosynthesis protein [Dethiobacter sp.]MBS3898459.1 exopolysaccharide biosynthesis protein [Dethiobacter sp.]MBS3983141.1 exopolysaccharide biosynthesis protein [Dethiobacter sp.]MCL4464118.1 exopolysaccharide biosynthesis protein [Bacillota bacterium]